MHRIRHVSDGLASTGTRRLVLAFWAAAGLALLGGVIPILFAGPGGRLTGVLAPFAVAAACFAACALLHSQGRTPTSILYFVAGLAIVFGLLAMLSLPLRLAVLGTCPAAPAPCTGGLPRPLSGAENTGIGAAAILGIASVFVGFFGLSVLYRRPAVAPTTAPTRRIPPLPPRPAPRPEPEPEPAPVETKAEAAEKPSDLEELPAPEELPELPAPPESTP